jgi:hypothetical protein
MRMPTNWIEWLAIVSSLATIVSLVLAIVSLVLYLRERRKREFHDTLSLGFLHGVKPLVESHTKPGSEWQALLVQINDILSRLQPPKPRNEDDKKAQTQTTTPDDK